LNSQQNMKSNVLILNFNGKHLLPECLESVSRQGCADFETLLIDNGSQDGSVKFVREQFPWVGVLALDANLGFCMAYNIALRDAVARGVDYVLILNNDTVLAPDCLQEMISAMEADDRAAVVCPKIYFADRPEFLWYAGGDINLWTCRCRHRGWREPDRGQFDGRRDMTLATGCAMLVRTRALGEAGLLDERFWAYLEDVEWSVRFVEKGYKLIFAAQAHVWHRDGATWVNHLGSGSQSKRQYLSTRNLLFLGWKHARWRQLPTFMLGFLIYEVGFYTLLRLIRRDFRALWAIYRGIGAAAKSILLDPSWSGWTTGKVGGVRQ